MITKDLREHADGDTPVSREWEVMCQALREMLLDGSLPPDEAYWWTRIIAEELAAGED